MRRYLEREHLYLPKRIKVALGRIMETEDDELAYAYYAANSPSEPYDRKTYTEAYFRRAYPLYKPRHLERAMGMVFKAVGLDPQGRLSRPKARRATWLLQRRQHPPCQAARPRRALRGH